MKDETEESSQWIKKLKILEKVDLLVTKKLTHVV